MQVSFVHAYLATQQVNKWVSGLGEVYFLLFFSHFRRLKPAIVCILSKTDSFCLQ